MDGGWSLLPMKAIMNESPLSRLSDTYLAALQSHFKQGPNLSLQAAHEIGREAVAIGLETLDLARIHEQALAALVVPTGPVAGREELRARAAAFFTEAITPIEETHRAALDASANLTQLHAALDERMLNLADASHELQHEIAGRTTAETALTKSQRSSGQLLKDSRVLEKQLRDMAHTLLTTTEAERHRLSLKLNDEIAQILLGINIRILALKNDIANNHTDLAHEIAATRQLVDDSAKIISSLAHEFSIQHER